MGKEEEIRNAKDYEEILDIQYGKIGTDRRDEFEEKAANFTMTALRKEVDSNK